jgi:two-component system response regulator DesR
MDNITAASEAARRRAAGSTTPAPPIRVLVAEDVAVVRETLVALLDLEDDMMVVAAVGAGGHIVPAAFEHRPDVALLDIDLPEVDGVSVAATLAERLPGCRTLILTGLARPGDRTRAAAAGARGFLTKDQPADDLVDAVRRVAHGERLLRP